MGNRIFLVVLVSVRARGLGPERAWLDASPEACTLGTKPPTNSILDGYLLRGYTRVSRPIKAKMLSSRSDPIKSNRK